MPKTVKSRVRPSLWAPLNRLDELSHRHDRPGAPVTAFESQAAGTSKETSHGR